jgi:hypothetical protein
LITNFLLFTFYFLLFTLKVVATLPADIVYSRNAAPGLDYVLIDEECHMRGIGKVTGTASDGGRAIGTVKMESATLKQNSR